MIYFVPAWHKQPQDWASTYPMVRFDDTSNHLQILRDAKISSGLIITDYQPQLTQDLNQYSVAPDVIMSVFDYLQGIDRKNSRVFDYQDFPWPKDSYFDFTMFRCLVVVDGETYAQVIFNNQGLVNWINFYKSKQVSKRLVVDSRGFISKQELYKDGKHVEDDYLNEAGVWRFKHYIDSDEVEINTSQPKFCEHDHYDRLNDLVDEVVEKQFLPQLHYGDQLIVSLDDDSKVSPKVYARISDTIFSVSRWHKFNKALSLLGQDADRNIVADNEVTAGIISNRLGLRKRPTVVPIFQSQFNLGHSQRLTEQRVAIFNENISFDQLNQLMEIEYQRMIKNPKGEAVDIIMYSPNKQQEARMAVQMLKQKYPNQFILKSEKKDRSDDPEVDNLQVKVLPTLDITVRRLVSNSDVLKALDKTRTIIDWAENEDNFMQVATVSVGIPQLRHRQAELFKNNHNGLLCKDFKQLKEGLDYYLGNLNHWNQSLAANVDYLNQYSEENLHKQWKKLLEKGGE